VGKCGRRSPHGLAAINKWPSHPLVPASRPKPDPAHLLWPVPRLPHDPATHPARPADAGHEPNCPGTAPASAARTLASAQTARCQPAPRFTTVRIRTGDLAPAGESIDITGCLRTARHLLNPPEPPKARARHAARRHRAGADRLDRHPPPGSSTAQATARMSGKASVCSALAARKTSSASGSKSHRPRQQAVRRTACCAQILSAICP
jgi:hypothetical protein